MHRIVGIPIIAHSSLQLLSGRTFVKLGMLFANLWQFKRLKNRYLLIEYVSIIETDFLYVWAILERLPNIYINNQWQPTQQVTYIYLTVPSSLTLEMIWIWDLYRFMYRQHVYDLEKRRGDCWSCWDLWIYGGRGFVGVQRWSCYLYGQVISLW